MFIIIYKIRCITLIYHLPNMVHQNIGKIYDILCQQVTSFEGSYKSIAFVRLCIFLILGKSVITDQPAYIDSII